MLKCPNCGSINLETNKYCYACEVELVKEEDKVEPVYHGVIGFWAVLSTLALIYFMFWFIEKSMYNHNEVDLVSILKYTAISAVVLIPVTLLYMAPTLMGQYRSDAWMVYWLNIAFGWTIIGWILVMVKVNSRDKCVEYQTLIEELRDMDYSINRAVDIMEKYKTDYGDLENLDYNTYNNLKELEEMVDKARDIQGSLKKAHLT